MTLPVTVAGSVTPPGRLGGVRVGVTSQRRLRRAARLVTRTVPVTVTGTVFAGHGSLRPGLTESESELRLGA
jgi:hypothetical protein